MSKLAQFQNNFQNALLDGDKTILVDIHDAAVDKNADRLALYQYAYGARLHDVLSEDYSNLHGYLGDDRFAALVDKYLAAHPSKFTNARWVGELLPEYLSQTLPFGDLPEIAQVAKLDRALNAVFAATDETPQGLEQLAAIAPEDWPQLQFTPVKAVQRLNFDTNAVDIWTRLRDELAPPAAEYERETQNILVYRMQQQANFRTLSDEEAMMWDEMAKGVRFGVLCELVATHGGEDDAAMRAASYLQSWLASELLAHIELV